MLPIAAAPAPSVTKTTVKPSTKGTLDETTRRAVPAPPSLPGSTLERAERYPGTSGRTQGVITDAKPAANEIARRTPISRSVPGDRRDVARSPRRAPSPQVPARSVHDRSTAATLRPPGRARRRGPQP